MKILISKLDQDLTNYRWIPIPDIFPANIVIGCEQGEAERIVCHDLFSSCNRGESSELLKYIAKRVKIGGEIMIIEPDLTSLLLHHYLHKTITIDDLNDLIFEDGIRISSVVEPKELEQILKELNFETSVNCQHGYIRIKGERKE